MNTSTKIRFVCVRDDPRGGRQGEWIQQMETFLRLTKNMRAGVSYSNWVSCVSFPILLENIRLCGVVVCGTLHKKRRALKLQRTPVI